MGGRIGALYGLNTLGAVLGTFLAGFLLVRVLGVDASTYVAAAVTFLIGIFACFLGHSLRVDPAPDEPAAEGPRRADYGPDPYARYRRP